MKKIFYTLGVLLIVTVVNSCEPEKIDSFDVGPVPSNASISVDKTDPHRPVFSVTADNGFNYQWDMGNGQKIAPGKKSATSYYPFAGTYDVVCTIYGGGAKSISTTATFTVDETDPTVATSPMWKELTGEGQGRTWVYNTNPATGTPDYCYQTVNDLITYPDNWMPGASWGQCVRITPDINGEMEFDLDNGINYTYHHVAGDAGVKGTFVLNADEKTITIVNPFILDHDIDCTNPAATQSGTYQIKQLTDDVMVLWQDQKDGGTGWAWSFKRK